MLKHNATYGVLAKGKRKQDLKKSCLVDKNATEKTHLCQWGEPGQQSTVLQLICQLTLSFCGLEGALQGQGAGMGVETGREDREPYPP